MDRRDTDDLAHAMMVTDLANSLRGLRRVPPALLPRAAAAVAERHAERVDVTGLARAVEAIDGRDREVALVSTDGTAEGGRLAVRVGDEEIDVTGTRPPRTDDVAFVSEVLGVVVPPPTPGTPVPSP